MTKDIEAVHAMIRMGIRGPLDSSTGDYIRYNETCQLCGKGPAKDGMGLLTLRVNGWRLCLKCSREEWSNDE
jgi:hypothetical protein